MNQVKTFTKGKKPCIPFFLLIIFLSFSECLKAQQAQDDYAQVKQAIYDYVHAIYESDTSKIYKSVHPEMSKRGFYFTNDKPIVAPMTFARLVEVAKTWRKSDRKLLESEITVFDVLNLTASAKVKADWGIDYFHLSKISGVWKIYNVMWQKHPPEKNK